MYGTVSWGHCIYNFTLSLLFQFYFVLSLFKFYLYIMASSSTMDENVTFKQGTIQRLLQLHFKEDKTKINKDALLLITELVRIFVNEGACRAAQQAKAESALVVEPRHLEKVLPQLLLDF